MFSARSARKSKSKASATHHIPPFPAPQPPTHFTAPCTPPTWVSPLLSYDLKRKIVAVAADDCCCQLLLLSIVAANDCFCCCCCPIATYERRTGLIAAAAAAAAAGAMRRSICSRFMPCCNVATCPVALHKMTTTPPLIATAAAAAAARWKQPQPSFSCDWTRFGNVLQLK